MGQVYSFNSIVIPEAASAAIRDLLRQLLGGSRLSLRSARMTSKFDSDRTRFDLRPKELPAALNRSDGYE
jgi:hypothetical protein